MTATSWSSSKWTHLDDGTSTLVVPEGGELPPEEPNEVAEAEEPVAEAAAEPIEEAAEAPVEAPAEEIEPTS